MLSGKEEISQPSPSHARATEGLPKSDGQEEADPEPVQDNLHDIVEGARQVLIEKKSFEIGELEQEVFHTSEEDCRDVSIGNLRDSKDTPPDECSGDVFHVRPEATLEIENPGPRQSPSSSQPITPSALPLHLIPLLPQVSPSPKRQRRSLGPSSNQADTVTGDFIRGGDNATGGTIPSPHILRSRLQNSSAEPVGISRTLAYAMDQMNATPLRGAELEELVMTGEAKMEREGDEATRPKTVRFEASTSQTADLAERLWTDAVRAAATARMHEESEQKMKRAAQSGSEDATSEMDANAWCTTESGSGSVEQASGNGSETKGATLASQTQTVNPAQLQEYTRLREQEVELRRAEAEVRILEERLEAREKDLKIRLATVGQRLSAIRQRKASINCQEEIIRQKLEVIAKETQESANGQGVDPTQESS